ncbi:MAG: hypothetical protein R2827_06600 [Bdellovibrionales bacterium]
MIRPLILLTFLLISSQAYAQELAPLLQNFIKNKLDVLKHRDPNCESFEIPAITAANSGEYTYLALVKYTGNPYLCEKIHKMSSWKNIDNPKGSRIHLLQSECHLALAASTQNPNYCNGVKPVCTPFLSGSSYDKNHCIKEMYKPEEININTEDLVAVFKMIEYKPEEWAKDLDYQISTQPSSEKNQQIRAERTRIKLQLLYWQKMEKLSIIKAQEKRMLPQRKFASLSSEKYHTLLNENPEEFWRLFKKHVLPSYEFAERIYYKTGMFFDYNKQERFGTAF